MIQVYTYEELITNDTFIAYCTTQNADAAQYWATYLDNFPDEAGTLDKAQKAVQQLHAALTPLAADEAANAFRRLLEAQQQPVRIVALRSWYKVAVAAAIVLTAAAGAWWWSRTPPPTTAPEIVRSMPGERKSLVLADGTKVILNVNSQLELHPRFKNGVREITLQGEAFFDVHQDAQHPFIIHTTHMDVKVLGTSFNIMAYKNDSKTETSLISGAVEVTLNVRPDNHFVLHPNEKITLENGLPSSKNNNAGTLQVSKSSLQTKNQLITETAWTNDKLAFNDETLEEVAHKLERWYGVQIQVDSSIAANYHYTAVFEKETLPQALHILQLILPFQYTINGTEVKINKDNINQ
jgi:transmembrane sensor